MPVSRTPPRGSTRCSARLLEQSRSIEPKLRAQLRGCLCSRAIPRCVGLYLWGGVGRGKTMLMDLFYESLRAAARRAHSLLSLHAPDSCAVAHASRSRAEPLDAVAEQLAARFRVICLDEFFVSDIADAMILAGLVRRPVPPRRDAGRHLQCAAAGPVQGRPAARSASCRRSTLLQNHIEVLHLDGGIDYRLRQLEQAPPTSIRPCRARAAQLAARFAALAGATAGGPTTLTVEHRHIAALATGAGMVWFEFARTFARGRAARTTTSNWRGSITRFSFPTYRCSRAATRTRRAASSCHRRVL